MHYIPIFPIKMSRRLRPGGCFVLRNVGTLPHHYVVS